MVDVAHSSVELPAQIKQQGSIQFPPLRGAGGTNSRWIPRRGSVSRGMPRRTSRAKSISEHTQEAVKVVAPPISLPLVLLCLLWYCSSAISSNLSKNVLVIFDYPVSLTMIQFIYAAAFSSVAVIAAQYYPAFAAQFPRGTISTTGLAGPDEVVLRSTAPMAAFQIVGHIFSHSATAQIPVSLVHAIKSLSPLLTVSVYTFALGMRYNFSTYLSLAPLTIGVIMSCAAEFRAKPFAIFYAFMSCVVFVAQNIWSKGLLTTGESERIAEKPAKRLDKVTIIFWCAVVGFIGTLPIWLLSDGLKVARRGLELRNGGTIAQLVVLVTLNGFSHFCQNLLSFMILGSISTVAYSIASLLKRVFVMTAAIFWFGQSVTGAQGWGIVLTFIGLYIYDRFGSKTSDVSQDRHVLPK